MKQTRLLKMLVAGALCAAAFDTSLAQLKDGTQLMSPREPPQTQTATTKPAIAKTAMATTTGIFATYTLGSDHFMFRLSPKAAPVRYYQTKDTVIVDSQGRVVDQSEIRPGVGANMYYTTSGDRMVVRKIILGQATGAPAKKATKTTTKK